MTVTSEPITLAVVFEPDQHGWVRARVPRCPQIVTSGRDHAQARELVCDALRELILSHLQPADAADEGAVGERLVVTIAAPGAP